MKIWLFVKKIGGNVLNIIEYLQHHSEKQVTLIFLDEEKAFNNFS